MTLFEIITAINEDFPLADGEDICRIVNELEDRIINEIFSPHGIARPRPRLNAGTDINQSLILSEENRSLYIYFIYAVLSIKELDFENSNAYSLLFNEKFKELSASYRRKNLPVKNTPLKGGV